jgi:6-pyruvoyltetrahydropterin/6-carboxytetrahydropterin synthase
MIVELVKEFRFEAAHLLPHVPLNHKCRRLHGHSFRCEVAVRGEVNPELGWFIDYAEITNAFAPLHEQLDHYYLNEIPGLQNPTSENLARWIWERLVEILPGLSRVSVFETCTSSCHYFGENSK